MKKVLSVLIALTVAIAVYFAVMVTADGTDFTLTMQIGNPVMTVNGVGNEIDPGRGTAPVVINDRTLVPIRAIIEAMGGAVEWKPETQTTILEYNGDIITLTIDDTTAFFNETKSTLDAAPAIINDRTMLPIRFIAESFNFDVAWNGVTQTITITENDEAPTIYQMDNGKNVYVYGRQEILSGSRKVPLVVFMCGTSGDPQQQAIATGWADKTESEDIIVISPDYNNYATYSEVEFVLSAINKAIELYPIDTTRIYSLGFSNGGATSVALASEHPEVLAGIAAYGWMVDMRSVDTEYDNYGIPFQVLQGTNEFIETDGSGNPVIMPDEQEAIRSLLLYNGMIDNNIQADYSTTPYWGYVPDNTYTETEDRKEWTINDYMKSGYNYPFAQLIMIEDARHEFHSQSADYSWNFLKNFRRSPSGEIIEEGSSSSDKSESSDKKTLIAYFSRVGNTDFPSDVDAVTSASIQLEDGQIVGNNEVIARYANNALDTDVFLIETAERYPADYRATVGQNVQEQRQSTIPALTKTVENMEQYDNIIIIYPTWAMSLPQAIVSFLTSHDVSGKTIYPINTNGGYGMGDTVDVIRKYADGATVDNGLAIRADDIYSSENKVAAYVSEIE